MTTLYRCSFCGAEGPEPPTGACPERQPGARYDFTQYADAAGQHDGHVVGLVMPATWAEYETLRTSLVGRAEQEHCGYCQQIKGGFGPSHWPMFRAPGQRSGCGGGNGAGQIIRAHCTCDACF